MRARARDLDQLTTASDERDHERFVRPSTRPPARGEARSNKPGSQTKQRCRVRWLRCHHFNYVTALPERLYPGPWNVSAVTEY
jgi:hypothetical protein